MIIKKWFRRGILNLLLCLSVSVFAQNNATNHYRVIIRLQAATSTKKVLLDNTKLENFSRKAGIPLTLVKQIIPGLYVVAADAEALNQLAVRRNTDAKTAFDHVLQTLAAQPDVKYAEEDKIVRLPLPPEKKLRLKSPNNFSHPQQWNMFDMPAGIRLESQPWLLNQAWSITQGDPHIIVGILDSGLANNDNLNANRAAGIYAGWNFVDDNADVTESDPTFHGTHVAGIIAAKGPTVYGVGPNLKFTPIKIMEDDEGEDSDEIAGIYWAAGAAHVQSAPQLPHPLRIINMSFGALGACPAAYQEAIDFAVSRGTLVVIAAGNDNRDASLEYPGNCQHVITVAATNRHALRAGYSNYGDTVAIAAPGGEMDSIAEDGILSTVQDTFAFSQGTSMAAPHVAGIAGLVLSVNPDLSIHDLAKLLEHATHGFAFSANPDLSCTGIKSCGVGIADAYTAVQLAQKQFKGIFNIPTKAQLNLNRVVGPGQVCPAGQSAARATAIPESDEDHPQITATWNLVSTGCETDSVYGSAPTLTDAGGAVSALFGTHVRYTLTPPTGMRCELLGDSQNEIVGCHLN